MTADFAAQQHVYIPLNTDATLAGLIDVRAGGGPAVYGGGLADQNAPTRHIIVGVVAGSDLNTQGFTALSTFLVSVTVRGEKWEDIRPAANQVDILLRRTKSVQGGKPCSCERISIQPLTQVDEGHQFRQVVMVFRVYVAEPEQ